MKSDLPGVPWLANLSPTGAAIRAAMRGLDESQWRAPEALRPRQEQLLAALVAHHAAQSGQFARRLQAAGLEPGDITTLDGLRRLPPLTRREIQTAEDLFAAEVPKNHGGYEEMNTSGSTGEPVHIRRTGLNQLDWWGLTMREHVWHRRNFYGRFAAIRAYLPGSRRQPSWGPPASHVCRTGESLGIPLAVPIAEQFKLVRDFGPAYLLLYPSNLDGLLDEAERSGQRVPGLREIRTVGESLSEHTRARAKDLLGVDITDGYSSQEFGYIATQCPVSGLYHLMAETLLVEIVADAGDPVEEGEVGRLLITDLRNYATPLIRYELRDHAERGPACPCGRGLPTLRRIMGRQRGLLVKPNGERTWPQFGRGYFRKLGGVIQYQFIQHDLERVEMKLVVEEPLTDERIEALKASIQAAMEHPFKVDFTFYEDVIPAGPNGKYEEFISLVSA